MSNIVKIGFLIILAALVALILRGFFIAASKPAESQQATVDRIRTAAADLPRGLLLRDDDLAWKSVPHAQAPAGAVIDGPQHDVTLKGAVLRHAVTAGAPILASDVIQANAPGFLSATLSPDMRAVSVAIDDVSGNAGLIQPGDYVDLILTQSMQGKTDSPDESVSSETVVQHARVLAVGSELTPSKDSVIDVNARARTVTLEVSPHTAEAIAVAARLGSLSLALRSFATLDRSASSAAAAEATSDALPSAQPVWAGDISRALRALPGNSRKALAGGPPLPSGPIEPATVMVYRGSNSSNSPVGDSNVSVNRGSGNSAGGNGPTSPTIGVPPLPSQPAQQTFGLQ